ncbi:uncharacterized protein LOC129580648 [Paramacrobiotus metropolitanus]|uniref:uncharacterized protein LOC129580648 n=1 Tax=Paramacrobiotus metropolitanus TaxID=2943436 RepID=UPI0024461409|nr:uncharacterized protein LOC129580648 [Paramacrobiotus metropolitanus]
MSIIFPTAVAAIVISLHGLLLPHRAKASVEYGLIYGDKFSPMEYAFECFGFSIPPHDMFRKLTGPLFRHCTVPDIATVGGSAQLGDPLKVKYQFHYKCSRPMSRSSWNPPVLRCVPENDCDSCVSIYSEALCQYDVVSLSRLWNGCTPIADEITKIDSTEDGGEIVMDLIQGRIIEAADNRNPGNHVSGRPYCDDAKRAW